MELLQISTDEYIRMAKRIGVLVSEENTLRDSRLKHEFENKTLIKQKNELKFEIAKLGASNVCIEGARGALIQQNQLLANTKRRLESDINILRNKRYFTTCCISSWNNEAVGNGLQKRN